MTRHLPWLLLLLCACGGAAAPQYWKATLAVPAARPNCDDATFTLFPDGRIQLDDGLLKSDLDPTKATGHLKEIVDGLNRSGRDGAVGPPPIVPALLCLKDYADGDAAALTSGKWPDSLKVVVTQEEGFHDELQNVQPGQYIALPNNPVALAKVEIFDTSAQPSSKPSAAEIYAAMDAADSDRDLLSIVRRLSPPQCDPVAVTDAEIAQLKFDDLQNTQVSRLRFSGIFPTNADAGAPQLLWIDANAGDFETNTKQVDKSTMRIWGFNIMNDGSQELAVIKGSEVVQTATVGSLVAYGLGVGLGTPFSISPGPPPAPTASGPSSPSPPPSSSASGGASQPAPLPSARAAVAATCLAPADGNNLVLKAVKDRLGYLLSQRAAAHQQATYTALMNYITVDGGFHYRAVVRETSALATKPVSAAASSTSSTQSDDGTVPSGAPVIGSETFTTYSAHRYASFAIEEAWNIGSFSRSGYGYVPVSQSGPDQFYQVEALNHTADSATFSGLFVVYPFPVLCGRHYVCAAGELSGLGLGFGPTFFRGGTAEFGRQWNVRLIWEPFPQAIPDLLLTVGGSWRSLDVPVTDVDPVGSLVSVPKPGTAPILLTTTQWEPAFSVGVSVDLAILTSAVSSVSSAVSGKTSGK